MLTRPFGATMGDVLTQDARAQGGLGFGTVGSSAVLAAVTLIAVILYTMRRDSRPAGSDHKCPRRPLAWVSFYTARHAAARRR